MSSRDPMSPNPDEWSEVWFDLPQRQRTWMIHYYKLRAVWTYLNYELDDFPRLRNGPIKSPTPWEDNNHPLNRKLREAESLVVMECGLSWVRWQDYQIGYVVCGYCPVHRCGVCDYGCNCLERNGGD